MTTLNELTERVIGCCIEVHKELGPGLLESVYEECLCLLLKEANISFVRQGIIPVQFRGQRLEQSFRYDVLVEKLVLLELKSVEQLTGLHQAQLLTYLKLSMLPLGLLCNFNVPVFRQGLRRLINPNYPSGQAKK
jgi:GxxExxY protein